MPRHVPFENGALILTDDGGLIGFIDATELNPWSSPLERKTELSLARALRDTLAEQEENV